MANFAEIDDNNIVIRVVAINNSDITVDGIESEQKGIEFCKTLWPYSGTWVQTSFSQRFRKNTAGIGYSYDKQRDAFIAPRVLCAPRTLYPSWVLNEDTCVWEPPVPSKFNGTDGKFYAWDEDRTDWVEIPNIAILG
jgi:hypothetical protein